MSPATTGLTHDEAIAAAQADYTITPEDGWRFHDGRTQAWSGWRCSFVDRRRRPLRKSFLIYDELVSREAVALAIAAWFNEVGR